MQPDERSASRGSGKPRRQTAASAVSRTRPERRRLAVNGERQKDERDETTGRHTRRRSRDRAAPGPHRCHERPVVSVGRPEARSGSSQSPSVASKNAAWRRRPPRHTFQPRRSPPPSTTRMAEFWCAGRSGGAAPTPPRSHRRRGAARRDSTRAEQSRRPGSGCRERQNRRRRNTSPAETKLPTAARLPVHHEPFDDAVGPSCSLTRRKSIRPTSFTCAGGRAARAGRLRVGLYFGAVTVVAGGLTASPRAQSTRPSVASVPRVHRTRARRQSSTIRPVPRFTLESRCPDRRG